METLLDDAARAGVRFEIDGDALRVIAPDGALTDAMRQALRENKAQIMDLLRAGWAPADEALPELIADVANREQPFPLTSIQHAYWLGRQQIAESGGVSTHMYFELDAGTLDIERLNDALCRVIARHDMLRAVIDENGLQRNLPAVPRYRIERTELSDASPDEVQRGVEAVRARMSHQVLPADRWPLFEVHAACLPEHRVRLHVSLDFLVVDAWSMFMLFREWRRFYDDEAAVLPPIELTYRDYVLAERRLSATASYRRAQDYWMRRIDTLPGAPELPLRAQGPSAQTPRFSRRRLRLEQPRWQKLKQRAQVEAITPSALLLSVFAEVLARWSATPHFTLNLTIFNRLPLHPHVNRLIGDFTSLLLVEMHCDGGTYRERARRLQKQLLDDLDHRELSGVEVLREWSKRHGRAMQAVMPVVFTSALVLGGEDGGDAGLMEGFGPMVYGLSQTPQVWLDHQVMEVNGALICNWDAVDAVFEDGVLDAMFAGFTDLIERLTDDAALWKHSDVAELPASMLREIRAANTTEATRHEALLHAGFIAQARAAPDAIAIVTSARTLAYGELLAESAAVALWLKAEGIAPGQTVAVLMHKGWEQVVAVLGILLAGGAYVPVDADLPHKRQQELLQLARVRQVLVQPGTAPLFPFPLRRAHPAPLPQAGEGSKAAFDPGTFSFYEIRAGLGSEAVCDDPAWLSHSIDQLAYVIFTSGTTGVPKGVMIDHRAAVNTVFHVNRLFNVTRHDGILAVSSLSFDLSVYDIFGLLSVGGRIVIPDAARNADPEHWLALIEQHRVTVWNSAPPLMTMLTSYMAGFGRSAETHLRLALLSGDWVPLSLKDKAAVLLPNARLISLGGATEASVWSIYHPIDRVEPHWKSIPYGTALPNQTMHVLNQRLQVCPVNVVGEIHIGGIGLARGYLNDADKTGKQFITHPDGGERLYRTGDVGRTLPGGMIEFLGRRDSQIKLRGHRVELGEIAATLRAHPAISEALVMVDGDSRTGQALWAYLQLDQDHRAALMAPVSRRGQAQRCDPAGIGASVKLAQQGKPLPSLTPDTVALWNGLDTLYFLALLAMFKSAAIFEAGEEYSIDEMMVKLRIVPRYRRWLQRAARHLADHGILTQQGERFRALAQAPEGDLRPQVRDVERRLMQVLSFTEREAQWFTSGAESLADILSEKIHSAELYTADETARIYQRLFADSHVQLRHAVSAVAASAGNDKLRVLEVGAGLGSATRHLLPMLEPVCACYDFTDLSNYFLDKAREKFSVHDFMAYRLYDLEKAPAYQGFEAHSYDLIVGSSVLHDVSDIGNTLAGLRTLLAPDGLLILLEETKFFASFDLTMGLQQGFDVFADESLRLHHPLLSRQCWRSVIESAGFSAVELLNVEGSAADYLGFDVIVAQAPASAEKLDEEKLNSYLLERLPAYMKPHAYQVLPVFPLTPNGKIDHKALARPPLPEAGVQPPVKPANALEQALSSIWCQVLNRNELCVDSSFFDIGGDSLLLVEVRNQIKNKMGIQLTTTALFAHPSISSLAKYLNDFETEEVPDA